MLQIDVIPFLLMEMLYLLYRIAVIYFFIYG